MLNMANQNGKSRGKINKQKEMEKRKRKKRKKTMIFLVIVILTIGLGAYLFTSPSFRIEEISIKGNNQLSTQKIKELAEVKNGENIFSIIGIVTKVKLKQSGYIEDATITKVYPNKIEIQVKERNKQFQIKTETGVFINIDEQGYIIDCSSDKLGIPTITGMEITENEAKLIKRLNEKDLNKMENILQIREQCKNIEIADKITQYQVGSEYIVSLENEGLTINLGDASNLQNRMYYVNGILKQEAGNNGTIYVNGNFNEGFSAYFSAQ